MKAILTGLAMAFVLAQTALAADGPGLAIVEAWARATPGSLPSSAAYFVIRNTGPSDDVLTGVQTDIAQKAELHESVMTGTMMQMKALGEVTIPAGQSVAFKPGGKHVMLMGLKGPLKKGDHFSLTLNFRNAGAKTVSVEILGVKEESPMGPAADMPMHQ